VEWRGKEKAINHINYEYQIPFTSLDTKEIG